MGLIFEACHKCACFVSCITKEDAQAPSTVLFLQCVTQLFSPLSGESSNWNLGGDGWEFGYCSSFYAPTGCLNYCLLTS